MWTSLVWILLISFSHPGSLGDIKWQTSEETEKEWERAARRSTQGTMSGLLRSSPSKGSDYLFMPEFVFSSASETIVDLFRPGVEAQPRPDSIQNILFPTTATPTPVPIDPSAETLCHIERLYVRVKREAFHGSDASKFLKLGKCGVNKMDPKYFLMVYYLSTDCGFTFESNEDVLIVYNTVNFKPTTKILRDLPFEIKIKCTYHRHINAYKGAIRPTHLGQTLHKTLRRRRNRPVLIIPQDKYGNEKTTPFKLGTTMYFEVRLADGHQLSANERLYINQCFITPSIVPSDYENTVIDNYGCMVDAKKLESEESAFIRGPKNIQRFSIKSGVLLEMATAAHGTKVLHIHCDVSVGPQTASVSQKACNYDSQSGTWKELYDSDSVCSCCSTSCPAPRSLRGASRKRITSRAWKIKS